MQSKLNSEASDTGSYSDFRTGLCRLFLGITGHLHESVVSSNLAALIISTGTRFHFSHDFVHIIVRQFEDYFGGNCIQFNMRWSRENQKGFAYYKIKLKVNPSRDLLTMCLE